jgi:polyphosphate kinase
VISILGRYLEHSRIFYFHNDGNEEIYLGSADLMPRNLNHRVEVVFPVERPEHVRYLRDHVLETYLKDNLRARIMLPDGTYKRLHPSNKEEGVDTQNWLMQSPSGRILR